MTARSASEPSVLEAWHGEATTWAAAARLVVIQQQTHCIFAPAARLWGSPPWQPALGLAGNLEHCLPHFIRFVDVARELRLDGYAITLPGAEHGATLALLARHTRGVLEFLSDRDPAGDHCMRRPIESPEWVFSFGGEPFFINTFAPCYPSGHSRYGFGADDVFVLLQPRHSFARAYGKAASVVPNVARARIRSDYAAHGRRYSTAISTVPFEAHRIVRPLQIDDPPVRFWEAG